MFAGRTCRAAKCPLGSQVERWRRSFTISQFGSPGGDDGPFASALGVQNRVCQAIIGLMPPAEACLAKFRPHVANRLWPFARF